MAVLTTLATCLFAVAICIVYIAYQAIESASLWLQRRIGPSPDPEATRLRLALEQATDLGEWLKAAHALDAYFPKNVRWKMQPVSELYHWQQIEQRIQDIEEAITTESFQNALILLQFGMVRGLGGITDPRLYNRVYVGTKALIEEYVLVMLRLIDVFFGGSWRGKELTAQAKMEHAERFRIAFGKTALVLQGGSVFGLYHLGVMKALHTCRLLPRVIVGTGTGALMAALAGVHTDEELPDLLNGRGINLDAFSGRSHHSQPSWIDFVSILVKRFRRFCQSGYVLDRQALEQCVEDNVGDTTFRESHERSGRVISITIETDSPGIPNCLNYLTTPHVLIRTAAMASNESDPDVAPSLILQRNHRGEIEPWSLDDESPAFRRRRRKTQPRRLVQDENNAPLLRVSQLENVNHFIISQARPYLVPFLAPSLHHPYSPDAEFTGLRSILAIRNYVVRAIGRELRHRMHQYDRVFGLPRSSRRFLLDEKIPFRSLTLVPKITPADFLRLLRNPTDSEIQHWVRLGEQSVWPCVSALDVRCRVEFALENRHSVAQRRSLRQIYRDEQDAAGSAGSSLSRPRARPRSSSAESNPF